MNPIILGAGHSLDGEELFIGLDDHSTASPCHFLRHLLFLIKPFSFEGAEVICWRCILYALRPRSFFMTRPTDLSDTWRSLAVCHMLQCLFRWSLFLIAYATLLVRADLFPPEMGLLTVISVFSYRFITLKTVLLKTPSCFITPIPLKLEFPKQEFCHEQPFDSCPLKILNFSLLHWK